MRRTLSTLAFTLAVSACDEGGNPAAPAAPTVTSISVTGADRVHIGAAQTYTASAVLSNGTTQVPVCTWGGDAASIASVDAAAGRVTGVSNGEVTIWCNSQGASGQKRLRVMPNYQGSWVGSYVIESCEQSGGFALTGFCDEFSPNRVLPTTGTLSQQTDVVTGAFHLGAIQGVQASAPIAGDGSVRLDIVHLVTGSVTLTSSWAINSTQAGQIAGSMTQLWRSNTLSGEGRLRTRVFNTNRLTGNGISSSHFNHASPSLSELRELISR